MFADSGNGHIDIQGVSCFFPKKPARHLFINYGLKKSDQKWTRPPLPTFNVKDIEIWDDSEYDIEDEISWEEASRQECIKVFGTDPWDLDRSNNPKRVPGVDIDPDYYMDCLEAFRRQEYDRIINGVWVLINGKEYYFPGPYYFYLTYWWCGDCVPEFRYTDLELFWLWEHVRLHPTLLGVIYITMRGTGKSYIAGCLSYWAAITKKESRTGVQSKTDDDAADFFRDQILLPVTKLPDFLVPINKHVGDITKNKEIDFSPPAKKNMDVRAYKRLKKEALYSMMNYANSGQFAYDGKSLTMYVGDEVGKTDPSVCDVFKRHQVVTMCVWRGNKKRGNAFLTTTVEEMQKHGGKECKKIWDDSDPAKINENKRTTSGLIRFFRSALEATVFDEYGFPVVENPPPKTREFLIKKYGEVYADGAKPYHDRERKSRSNDQEALVAYKQKNPYTIVEAFWVTGDKCIYNKEILLTALDRCESVENKPYRKGDIVWKEKDKEAMWVPNSENGRWTISWVPPDEELNRTQINDGWGNKTFTPKMSHRRVMAFDPFATEDVVDEGKASDGAAAVYNKANFHVDENFCDTIIADYRFRPNDPFECYEDILTAAFFFSCSILVEKNKSNFFDYARHRGYKWGNKGNSNDFIMERPESTITDGATQTGTDGIYSGTGVIAHYTTSTRSHIVTHGHKLKHPNIIKDWIEFNPKNTKKFDSGVAGSLAVVANEKIITQEQETIDLSGIFQTYNNTGTYSEING